MTNLPTTVWLAYQGFAVKAAPERIRPAGDEEHLSISGWLDGITEAKQHFLREPNKGYLDVTKDTDLIPGTDFGQQIPEDQRPEPARRVRCKTSHYPHRCDEPVPAELLPPEPVGPAPVLEQSGEGALAKDMDAPMSENDPQPEVDEE